MKVQIIARGREVSIECGDANVSPREVRDLAIEAWREIATHGPDGVPTGFTPAEVKP